MQGCHPPAPALLRVDSDSREALPVRGFGRPPIRTGSVAVGDRPHRGHTLLRLAKTFGQTR